MSYRAYTVLMALMLFGVGALLILFSWLPAEFTAVPGQLTGGLLVVISLVAFGMSIMMPNRVPCPHCGVEGHLRINFWTGRPELWRVDPTSEPLGHGHGPAPMGGGPPGPPTGPGTWRQG